MTEENTGHCLAKPGELSHLPHAISAGGVVVSWWVGYTVNRRLHGPQWSSPGPAVASGSCGPLTARDSGTQSRMDHSNHMALPGSWQREPCTSFPEPGSVLPEVTLYTEGKLFQVHSFPLQVGPLWGG